jgi:pilus assembly protein CpaE
MMDQNRAKILIVDDDPVTTSWLRALLEPEGYQVAVARSGKEAIDHVRAAPPALILLDLILPDTDGVDLCRNLRLTPGSANAWIIILSSRMSREDIAAGLGAGADDFIPKRRGADSELLAKSKQMLGRRRPENSTSEETRHGHIVSFFSAKGGSGTTTLAVNTTYAIPEFAPKASTLLVDMVFPLGAVGYMIGSRTTETIARLSHQSSGSLDPGDITRHTSPKGRFGFNFLLSAKDLEEAESLEVARVLPLFGKLREMFDVIVIDFGHSLSRITLPILETSDLICAIVIPDVTAVALTQLSLGYLASRRVPRDRILLIQNRTVPRSWLSKEDMEKEFGMPVAITIPYDGEQIPLSTNAHEPYLERYGNSVAALTMRELGRLVVERLYHLDKAPVMRSS